MPLTIGRDLIQFLQRRLRKGVLYCGMACGRQAYYLAGGSGWCGAHGVEHYMALQQAQPSELRFLEQQYEEEGESALM